MRKKRVEEIQTIIRKEFMKQAVSIVESIAYYYLDYKHLDLLNNNNVEVKSVISNICFETYLLVNGDAYEIAHYHYDDAAWVITNQSDVRISLQGAIDEVADGRAEHE